MAGSDEAKGARVSSLSKNRVVITRRPRHQGKLPCDASSTDSLSGTLEGPERIIDVVVDRGLREAAGSLRNVSLAILSIQEISRANPQRVAVELKDAHRVVGFNLSRGYVGHVAEVDLKRLFGCIDL